MSIFSQAGKSLVSRRYSLCPLKNGLAELYKSEYPKLDRGGRKRLKLNKAVAGSFQKRIEILSEAIEEINLDIQERERKSRHVQDKTGGEISHLDFVLEDFENWKFGL